VKLGRVETRFTVDETRFDDIELGLCLLYLRGGIKLKCYIRFDSYRGYGDKVKVLHENSLVLVIVY
jgi:hypothetical protein